MHFEVVGEIDNVETIAVGGHIRDIMRLRKQFGTGRWRKLRQSGFRREERASLSYIGTKHMKSVKGR